MPRRTRKIFAEDVPAEVGVPDPRPPQEDATQVSPEQSMPDAVSTAPECETIALVSAPGSAAPRPGSKLGIVLGLLEAAEGASLARLVEVTGWLPHTTRAALTGLRKRGYAVSKAKAKDVVGGSVSIYRVGPSGVSS